MTDKPHHRVLVVNPDDLNLADAKAVAARHDASAVASRIVPPGRVFVVEPSGLKWLTPE